MALLDIFKKDKGKERFKRVQKEKKPEALPKASNFAVHGKAVSGKKDKPVITPHVAEKSTFLNEAGVYVFKVKRGCNKPAVARAVKELYGAVPRKINIVNLPGKRVFVGGRHGVRPGFKKAMVYLKKGDKIEMS